MLFFFLFVAVRNSVVDYLSIRNYLLPQNLREI